MVSTTLNEFRFVHHSIDAYESASSERGATLGDATTLEETIRLENY